MLKEKTVASVARQDRKDFVRRVSINNNSVLPFGDYQMDSAARRFIETGERSLLSIFPTTYRRL